MPFEFQNALDSDPTIPKDDDILRFVENALRVADRQTILTLGKVSNAQLILEKTGLNVTGFTRVLDNYGVRHTLKQHGNSVKEDRRGQIAVTAEDFAKISSITSTPDNIFADGKNKIGRDVIVFVKLIDA